MYMASCHEEREGAPYALRTPVAGESIPGVVFDYSAVNTLLGNTAEFAAVFSYSLANVRFSDLERAADTNGAEAVVD